MSGNYGLLQLRLCGEVFGTILSDSSFFIYGKHLNVDIESKFCKFSNTEYTSTVNKEKCHEIRINNKSPKLSIFNIK